ncbi:lipopolysaccharide core heptose(II) kinase RfaY [Novilysobacter defluvii]|uniref:non-specific serine/threonine protein kinase n=1 Tax=Lysobacter defluvii IMMIB APB-9 = DSM 18482 TaxID=1385515 RepID=A0A0A0M7Y4_9GAMM|nr:lipopolysaccharide core heptose(II) kinase RfaY [Lysobacter defluvii]KGO98324.1 kinase [Lysobacter defluvii IMMIB APB-9 = DSM 18482]
MPPQTSLVHAQDHAPSPTRTLKRGTRVLEPDVYVARLNGRRAVLKDYRRYRRTPLAPLARLLVRREARNLERLRGWGHAPQPVATTDALVLGMEYIDGQPLGDDMSAVSTDLFQQLRAAVGTLHAAGIAHNDLHRSNILVSGGVPKVVDFAAALAMPGWLARSGFGRQLLRSELAKVVKLQTRLAGTAPSPEDARVLVDPGWVRALRGTWTRLYRGAGGRGWGRRRRTR